MTTLEKVNALMWSFYFSLHEESYLKI